MPSLQHFVITRFSYRNYGDGNGNRLHKWDPLDPERIAFRFSLFEVTCLPSLIGQACQNFTWILVIDPALPLLLRKQLQSLISVRTHSFIHEYMATDDILTIDWLSPYIEGSPEYIVTTNVDDDDALTIEYVEALQNHVLRFDSAVTPFKVFATLRAVEWDMLVSPGAPLGTVAPWHRGPFAVSCGYSFCARYPLYNCSVFGLPPHNLAERIFDSTYADDRCSDIRQRFTEIAERQSLKYDSSSRACFCDLGLETDAVVMTNHHFNVQVGRLSEPKNQEQVVTGPSSLPGVAINWQRAVGANSPLKG
jgi:hypothetical protein